MLKQVSASDLDGLHYRLECAANLINAVHSAMVCGDFWADPFTNALYGAMDYLDSLVDEVKALYTGEG